MTAFDAGWAIIKAPITEDEAFRIFDAHRREEPWKWENEDVDELERIMPGLIMSQVNEPSNLAPFVPFTGQTLYRAGDPSGRFFTPQLMTAQQYAGWKMPSGPSGKTREINSFVLPEVDPDRVYLPQMVVNSDGGRSLFPFEGDELAQMAYLLYHGNLGDGGIDHAASLFQNKGKDWVVIPEYASQNMIAPSAANMVQRTSMRDPELRQRVLSDLGATEAEYGPGAPQQWGLFYAGGEKGRPQITGQRHDIDPETWRLMFRGPFKR